MNLTVNGIEHEIRSDALTSLLRVLREELFILSPKAGCEQGGCGACTVLIDGEPRRSCLTPVAAVEGTSVTTFCSPGMIVASTALLNTTPNASREQIMEALEGHICRCTGYVKIIDAVESVSTGGSR